MEKENIQWFLKLIEQDRKNNKASKKEITELMYRFVHLCPSKKGTDDVKKFFDYGLNCNSDYGKLKKMFLKKIDCSTDNYIFFNSTQKNSDSKTRISRIYKENDKSKKAFIYICKGEFSEIDTLFIRLRNAFAHNYYFKKGRYYINWNEGTKKGNISCFMFLKFEQIISIYQALEGFEGQKKNLIDKRKVEGLTNEK